MSDSEAMVRPLRTVIRRVCRGGGSSPVFAVVLALLLCSTAVADGLIQTVTTLHDTIPLYGTQADNPQSAFTADADETVIVPEGQSLSVAGIESALDVLVRGTLVIPAGTELRCRTLTAVGLNSRIEHSGTLTVRDIPIDTTIDPKKWGHGLLVIDGTLKIDHPDFRQPWATLAAEVNAGSTSIILTAAPQGWRAGDQIVLPDTRQPATGADISAQTEQATVASVNGTTITLAAPVAFSHLGWHKSDGTVGMLPDVGCLTQPVVIRSENQNGTRGHCLFTQYADVEARGVLLSELGRTTTAPLGASNQIGRYAWHFHHLLGRRNNGKGYQFLTENVAIHGSPKWGVSVHSSHFGILRNVLAYNCAGSGIVTEEVYSYGNQITGNMVVAKQAGSGLRITDRSGRNDPLGDHWHDRGGFGLSSAMNLITGNRAYCCKESYGMAGFGSTLLYKPTEPGVCPTCAAANRITLSSHMGYVSGEPRRYPFLFDTSGNVAWGGWRGIETWTADCYVGREKMFPGLTLVHCRNSTDLEDQEETTLYGWRVLGDHAQATRPQDGAADATYALDFKPAYRFGITAIDCEFKGHDAAYRLINDDQYTRFQGCTFECPTVNYMPQGRYITLGSGWTGEWTNCTFNGDTLFADGWYPKYDLKLWLQVGRSDRKSRLPIRYFVRPWKDGRDYQVYHYEQLPTFQMPPIAADKAYGDWPLGATQQQVFGDTVPSSAVPWGKFWADNQTPCEREVELLRQELQQAQGN